MECIMRPGCHSAPRALWTGPQARPGSGPVHWQWPCVHRIKGSLKSSIGGFGLLLSAYLNTVGRHTGRPPPPPPPGVCDRVFSRRLDCPQALPPLPLLSLSPPPHLSPSFPLPPPLPLHLRKLVASRQPAIETLRGKSHRAAISSCTLLLCVGADRSAARCDLRS